MSVFYQIFKKCKTRIVDLGSKTTILKKVKEVFDLSCLRSIDFNYSDKFGIINFLKVISQIISALIGGPLVKHAYCNPTIYGLVMSGISFLIVASLVYKVKDVHGVIQS
ncbi:hypothetical protein N9K07_06070 [Arenitalea sp.]|nr:hypothetical protein [Algibacter sp.]MDA9070298.1 hypothetical protein [Algibacter sp.]